MRCDSLESFRDRDCMNIVRCELCEFRKTRADFVIRSSL